MKIYKNEKNKILKVKVKSLNKTERIKEIATLISGDEVLTSGYEQAKILLANG